MTREKWTYSELFQAFKFGLRGFFYQEAVAEEILTVGAPSTTEHSLVIRLASLSPKRGIFNSDWVL